MNIFFIGDIVGSPGREAVSALLKKIIRENTVDFVIANGENAAGGKGITPKVMEELIYSGIDVLTSGNHVWKRKEVNDIINEPQLLRPANYPEMVPGRGFNIYESNGVRIGVVNLQGRIFMEPIDCPFATADKVLAHLKNTPIKVVDIHAEATSEKLALGFYLDGKVSAVVGTHTHVQTSDAGILPEGTAYITDAGMTGSKAGIIGVEKEEIIKKFLTGMPFRFKISRGEEYLEGVILDIDEKTGMARSIRTVRVKNK